LRSARFLSGLIRAGIFACVLSGGAAATAEEIQSSVTQTTGTDVAVGAPDAAFNIFLDRLMRAESDGRNDARNPFSSALGPFQFINSTFLAVMRRHFPDHVARMNARAILALRTKRDIARRAAEAFSKDNMAYLVDKGLTPTFGHLRLAYLLGPQGAARVLQAPPSKPVAHILGGRVIAANPFMRRMTAADLIARATRDVSPRRSDRTLVADTPAAAPQPQPPVTVAEVVPDTAAAPASVRIAAIEPSAPAAPEQPAAAAEVAPTAETAPTVAAPPTTETEPTAAAPPRPAARASADFGTVHRGGRVAVINVKCDPRLASCRRWIDEQVAKLSRVSDRSDAGRGS
jgi:hypothetical protein